MYRKSFFCLKKNQKNKQTTTTTKKQEDGDDVSVWVLNILTKVSSLPNLLTINLVKVFFHVTSRFLT